jgi:DNA-binding NarL/FixJ family response regulator
MIAMAEPMRIVVAEDHVMVRAGLVEIINSFPEFEVVAEAGTGRAAISMASRLQPDLMVLDLDMPDTMDPAVPRDHTAREVIAASPKTQVVILTMHDEPATVRDLLRAGISGFLAKTAGPAELHGALTAAARADGSIFVEVPRHTLLGLSMPRSVPAEQILTAREVEILTCVANGSSNRDLAKELYIAEATVKRHLDRIFKKLDVNSRIGAINRARELNLI